MDCATAQVRTAIGEEEHQDQASQYSRDFGICTGCTGVPEGDPLSVVAMRSFSRLFDCVVSASPSPTLTTGRCSRAIATSWCPCTLSWLLSWVLAGCLWPLGNVGLTWTSNKWRFGRLRSFSFLFTGDL